MFVRSSHGYLVALQSVLSTASWHVHQKNNLTTLLQDASLYHSIYKC